MATTVTLTDGTTTLALNDGSVLTVRTRTLRFPPPAPLRSMSGPNLSRDGQGMIARTFSNRTVTMEIVMDGSSTSLETSFKNVQKMLRLAREYEQFGAGSRMELQYKRGSGTQYNFQVLDGVFDQGAESQGPALTVATHVIGILTLTCKPFAEGTAIEVENYVKDPSFEIAGTPKADWCPQGTSTRDTTLAKFGLASGKIDTNGGNSAGWSQRTPAGTFAEGDVVSLGYWRKITENSVTASKSDALNAHLIFENSSNATITDNALNEAGGVTDSDFVHKQILNKTAPANTDHVRLRLLQSVQTGGSEDITGYYDGVVLAKGSTISCTFVSSRYLGNHFDDNAQCHTNYIDIYCTPGDVPGALQVKLYENEAHTKIYLGAREAGRMLDTVFLEAECFTGLACAGGCTNSHAGTGNTNVAASTTAASPLVVTEELATPPNGAFRVLVRGQCGAVSCSDIHMGVGYSEGGVTQTPSTCSQYVDMGGIGIYELGSLQIPAKSTPDNQTQAPFTIRLAMHNSDCTQGNTQVDYMMLLPVDVGFGIIGSKASSRDVVLMDSESDQRALALLNTSDVIQSYPPCQQSNPPGAHPCGTRIYAISDNGSADIADGWTVGVRIVPRYLQVI